MVFNPRQQTKVQYLVRLRERYRAAAKMEACRLANRILRHLADGDVTQAQMLNAWNMTQAEWDAKVTNTLQPKANKWLAYKAAAAAADNEAGD